MDSIGDYIYLIIIIVAAFSGVLKKKKKKPTVDSEPSSSEIPDILKEFMEGSTENDSKQSTTEVVESIPSQKKVITPTESYSSFENTENIEALKAKKEITRHNSTLKKNSDHNLTITNNTADNEKITFDAEEARKAILYTEIMNRKY